jgi:magnesium transporter
MEIVPGTEPARLHQPLRSHDNAHMGITTFDGTAAIPASADDLHPAPSGAPFTWTDIKIDHSQGTAQAQTALTHLGLPAELVDEALRPNRAGQLTPNATGMTGVTWVVADGSTGLAELHFSWTPSAFITVRWGGDAAIKDAQRRVSERPTNLFDHPASALGVILQFLHTGLDLRVLQLGQQVATVEDALVERQTPDLLRQVRVLRAQIGDLLTRLVGYYGATSEIAIDSTGLPGMDAAGAAHLAIYSRHVNDTLRMVDAIDGRVRDALVDYQAGISGQQATRIDQLTIVSLVFLPISFLTGYFGQNFEAETNNMTTAGSFWLLGVALPIAVAAVAVWLLFGRPWNTARRARSRRNVS